MTTSEPSDPLAADHLYSLASIEASRSRIASALTHRCSRHDAEPGAFCWSSRFTVARGICLPRFERGIRGAHSIELGAPRAAAIGRPRLEHRHPNRHPIAPVRAEVGR